MYEPNVDCVIAINILYQYCSISNKPINFNPNSAFKKIQDLIPIQIYIYSCMGWRRETYINSKMEGFKGLFSGSISLVKLSKFASMLIKYEKDFILCSKIEDAMSLFQIPNIDIINSMSTTHH